MSNVKFTQLPNLGTPTAATIIPVVDGVTNYTVTGANLQTFVNNTTGNITGGNIAATGNVTGTYILGNGSQLTGLPAAYGNANVTAFLPTYTGNLNSVSAVPGAVITGTVANATYALTANSATFATIATFATTANAVAGANVSGTVANATYALTANSATYATVAVTASTANAVAGANVSGTVANATYATNSGSATTATSATTAGTVTTAAQPAITSVGTLTGLTVTGNTTGGNLLTGGVVSAVGNITGAYFFGNGSQLTGITGNGGGSANSISFGNTSVNIPVSNGNISFNVGGVADQFKLTNLLSPGFVGAQFNTGVQIGNSTNLAQLVTWGNVLLSANGSPSQTTIGGPLNIPSHRTTTSYLTVSNEATLSGGGTVGANLSISGGFFGSAQSTRANNSAGTAGQISVDTNYIYVCTAANTWKRVALVAF